ncbi:Short chain dehydrogenase, partial [Globisporangium splendens]
MDQETVLITGSTRGIGLKFAELYKQRGWKVIGAARDLNQAEQVGSQQFRVHPLIICTWRLLIVQLDTGDEASILNAAEELEGEAIDFLINNAGIFAGGHLDATTKDDLLKQFEINSVGPFLVTRAFLPHLRLAVKARGSAHVVHVTSRLGSIALCGEPYFGFKTGGYYGYRASKAALNMINASLAVDLKPDSIGTFVLHPGFVMTDLTENHGDITADTSVSGMMRAIDSLALADSGKFFDFKGEAQPCMPYAYGSLVAEQHLSITYNDLLFLQQQQTPSLCTLLLSIVETARGIISTQTTDDDGVGLFEQSNRPPHVLAAAPRSPPSRYEAGLWKLYETLEVAIKPKGVVWINVYAPNKKAEQEHFFRRLNEEFWTHRAAAVLGGDCNCVLDKQRDRRQLIEEQANAAREAAEFKFGKYMQATQGDARHFFRRIANWQRDQTISRLEPTSGRYHPPNASLADITGAEWHQITGQSHATVPPHKAEQRFDALVYIPETRKVTEAQNQDLMAPITEKEVREAIAALHRHKAGGVDSLNNDFYKDREDVMVDVLVREFNNIQRGAPMPRSFGQGIVIPLRKKGDSPNPLDYRPITLLTTTYKLFAKVLATRLQDILLWIVGEEQQGFVRDRLMENAILIMQAALDKAYHSSTEGFDDAPGIVVLDFMKAYDTLDRDFLYLVLSKFGFGRQFVDLVRRMHTDTTAQYLVNGELSREWEVKSGIRQGYPLAPLLFIVAAEILALAIDHRSQSLQQCGGESTSTEFGLATVDSVHCQLHRAPSEGRGPASESTKAIFVEIDTWYKVHRDKSQNWGCCAISPKERSQHAQTRLYQTNNIHRLGWEYLGEDLMAAEGRNPAWKDNLKRQIESLLPTVDLEWRSDGRVGVYFGGKPEQTIHQLSEETRAFWPSFQWNNNPWIIDSQGEQYTAKTVSFLKECNLASFNVRREEERVFSVRLPTMTATLTSKRRAVLRKLVTSIILCSPEIEIDAGNQLISHQEPWSRKHTKREYKWISNGMGTITGVPVSERNHTDYIQMQRQANGVLWTVTDWTGDATCQQDVAMIEEEIKTVRAVARRMRTLKGEKIKAACLSQLLSVLERQDLSRQLGAWATAHLYFDGGARGNPGPGGSGWAFIFLNERSNRWGLKACGYAYMGPEATNNWCEYSALEDGLAYSARYLQHYEVQLEVFGDSQMIIASQNGIASIRQTELQPLAVRVNQIIANFAWISWNHTKREQNKMTDLLANMAMNSKSAKILTDESRGNDQVLMSQVAALLDNDIEPKEALNQSSMAPKTVLITGSTRGIGLTLAEHYAKLGWHVIGAARDPAAADTIVQLDSTDEASIQSAAQALEGDAIDLLINNAGIFSADGLESATKTELMKQFEVNSVASNGMWTAAAVNMINSSLAIDLKSDSIGAFVLHPGYVITDLTGHEGDVTSDTSVAGLVGVIDKFTLADSGKFYDFTGKNLPW